MAKPHVAGAGAILKQQHPDWNGEQLKPALQNSERSASKVAIYDQGADRCSWQRRSSCPVVAHHVRRNVADCPRRRKRRPAGDRRPVGFTELRVVRRHQRPGGCDANGKSVTQELTHFYGVR
jgi:hypothetical protein